MASYRLSRKATEDLVSIGAFTAHRWGVEQADHYISQIESVCSLIAEHPTIGRSCRRIKDGLFRIETGKHVVFYELQPSAIVIQRILHQQMQAVLSLFSDEED